MANGADASWKVGLGAFAVLLAAVVWPWLWLVIAPGIAMGLFWGDLARWRGRRRR